MGFDYEPIARCQHAVDSNGTPAYEQDCGEPATFNVYFDVDDNGRPDGPYPYCVDHLLMIAEEDGVSIPEYIRAMGTGRDVKEE